MTIILLGEDKIVGEFVKKHIPHLYLNSYTTIGILSDDKLIAGCVYHRNYADFGDIEMSIAAESPRWATKFNILALLDYPFNQLNCIRVTACSRGKNSRTRGFLEGIGFKQEGVIRRGFGDDDTIVYGMLKEEAGRWLNLGMGNGKKSTKGSSGT